MKRIVLDEKISSQDLIPGEIYTDYKVDPVFLKFVKIEKNDIYFEYVGGDNYYGRCSNGLIGFSGLDLEWHKTKI